MGKGTKRKIIYDGSLGAVRADVFLAKWLPDFSRARLTALAKQGFLTVDGENVRPAFKLTGGETVIFYEPNVTETALEPVKGELEKVYEDENFLVINKPAGLTVHPGAGTGKEPTLVQILLAHYPKIAAVGDPERPGIVHRIDKDTSGLLMIAKTEAMRVKLLEMFSERSFTKEYRALVLGLPRESPFELRDYLARSQADRKKIAVTPNPAKGKEAITLGETIAAFGTAASELSLTIETGRTHQIRVQMAHYGHPVLGDPLYGRSGNNLSRVIGAKRQMLHANSLTLIHPITKEELYLEAPLPNDYLEVREKLEEIAWRR